MKVYQIIETPWAPYSVMFSCDGKNLAIGGGTWYGNGGLILYSLDQSRSAVFPLGDVTKNLHHANLCTVSGVCFSNNNRYIVASTWSSRHHYSPALVFEVSGLELKHIETLVHKHSDGGGIGAPCPTGVIINEGIVIVRNNTSVINDVIATFNRKELLGDYRNQYPYHTSSRLAIIKERAITGGGGSLRLAEWQLDTDSITEKGKSCSGMINQSLNETDKGIEIIPIKDCGRVTAISKRPNDCFITGGLDGEIDKWDFDNIWVQQRLRESKTKPEPKNRAITWATYKPSSIVGICTLDKTQYWVAIDASSGLQLWENDKLIKYWQLPYNGTPRSIAASPENSIVAIAIKDGGFTSPKSKVVLIDLTENI